MYCNDDEKKETCYLEADLHIHSTASGHAYSAIEDICRSARAKGLKMVAITDHGPAMPGGPHFYYFGNSRVLPDEINGVRVLFGVEANILNQKGDIDLIPNYVRLLDIVWAGLHAPCWRSVSRDDSTKAILAALENPYVDGVVHPGNPDYKLDLEAVARRAADRGKLVEINNSSHFVRPGSRSNCLFVAEKVKEFGGMVAVNSDAHYSGDVGNCREALEMLREVDFPRDRIINASANRVAEFLKNRRAEVDF